MTERVYADGGEAHESDDVGYWRWFADLGVASALAVLALVAFLVPATPWPIRWTLGVCLVVLVPGYALATAAFPERADFGRSQADPSAGTPSWPVVAGFAVVGSALASAIVATGFLVFASLELVPVAIVLVLVTVAASIVAAVRRALLPPYARRAPLRGGAFANASSALPGGRQQTGAFVAAIVLLVAAVGLTAAFPPAGQAYSEFAVLDENADGNLVAEDYPAELVAGEGHTFHFAIENHEQRRVTYTVVIVAQDVENGEVTAQRQLDAVAVQLDGGEETTFAHDVVPRQPGDDVRLQFLLYKGEVPASPSAASADIRLQIWTDVVAGNGANASANATESVGAEQAGTSANAIGSVGVERSAASTLAATTVER